MNKQNYFWNSPQPGRPQDRWEGLLFVEEIQLRNKQTIKEERRREAEMKRKYLKPNWTQRVSKRIKGTVNAEFAYDVLFTVKISSVTDEVHLLLYRLLFPSFCEWKKNLSAHYLKNFSKPQRDISQYLFAISLVKGLKSDNLSKREAVCTKAVPVKGTVLIQRI